MTVPPPPANGVIPPLVTPLLPDGTPDLESVDSLVDHLIGQGVTGLLALGSCGENGALTRDERIAVAARVLARAGDRVHVMVCVPALGTRDAMADAREYAALGAHALLAPAPFVFPHSPVELARHFRGIAEAGGVPLLAYNLPGRTNVTLEPALLRELAADGTLVGLKDSSSDIEKERLTAEQTRDLSGFRRYTGSEFCIDALLLGGFHGAVPGLANVFAPFHVALARCAAAGDWPGAATVQGQITELFELYRHPLCDGSFSAAVVGGLKEGLVQQGVIAHSTTAFPFVQVDDPMRAHIGSVLARASAMVAPPTIAVSGAKP